MQVPDYTFLGAGMKFFRVLELVRFMGTMFPVAADDEWGILTRWDVASGIVAATPYMDEQVLLITIARWESGFDPLAVYCHIKPSTGASGPFQVIPRSKAEAYLLCHNMKASAGMGIQRAKESFSACSHLPKQEQLAQYTTGKCDEEGRAMSRNRWGDNKKLVNALYKCCTTP